MGIELVTGHTGGPHVTAAQDARRNAGIVGTGRYVLATGNRLRCTVDSANQVTVGTGDGIMDGRHVTVESPTSLAISSGTQLASRHDLVCVHYSLDQQTGVESAELVVVEGTASSGSAVDPPVSQDSLLSGSVTETWWPLWRIPISGVNVGTPVLLSEVVPVAEDLGHDVAGLKADVAPLKALVPTLVTDVSRMQGKVTALGATYEGGGNYGIGNTSIDSLTTGPSITLPRGTYIIMGQWSFASVDGARVCQCAIGASTSVVYRAQRIAQGAGNYCRVQCSCIRSLSSDTKVYLFGSSTKKSAATQTWINAVRIA